MATSEVRAAGDLVVLGDVDGFKLIREISSSMLGYKETTEAMDINGHGCLLRTAVEQGSGGNLRVSESTSYIPACAVVADINGGFKLVSFLDELA